MKLDTDVAEVIDAWNICPFSDPVDELFDTLRLCTEAYLGKGPLDTQGIISIVKDMRDHLNPHGNENMFHFTDIICDAILLKFEGLSEAALPDFIGYTRECENRVFMEM